MKGRPKTLFKETFDNMVSELKYHPISALSIFRNWTYKIRKEAKNEERAKVLTEIGDEIKLMRADTPGLAGLSAAWGVIKRKVSDDQ